MIELMGLVETKNIFDAEPPEEKAKAAIVGVVNGKVSILNLIRSMHEDTRVGEGDWVGGTLDPGEMPIDGLIREAGQELPGASLQYITELTTRKKIRQGLRMASHLFAAIAKFPDSGIGLSEEHSDYEWVPLDEYPGIDIPNKYKEAVASPSGLPVIKGLALIARHEPAVVQQFAPVREPAAIPELLAA
jgi:8-oxo-dGTP pyrophosphatase MutT (NUDIX family)